jgi:hypothetical protein
VSPNRKSDSFDTSICLIPMVTNPFVCASREAELCGNFCKMSLGDVLSSSRVVDKMAHIIHKSAGVVYRMIDKIEGILRDD